MGSVPSTLEVTSPTTSDRQKISLKSPRRVFFKKNAFVQQPLDLSPGCRQLVLLITNHDATEAAHITISLSKNLPRYANSYVWQSTTFTARQQRVGRILSVYFLPELSLAIYSNCDIFLPNESCPIGLTKSTD